MRASAHLSGRCASAPEDGIAILKDAWRGRETPFSLVPVDDPLFDRRLVLPEAPPGAWIVLTYRLPARGRPQRPLLRLRRAGRQADILVLPGLALDAASWLGRLPRDCVGIEIAAGSGFVLERVGLRAAGNLLAEASLRRPLHAAAALRALVRGDERRWRDSLRGACAVRPMARYPAWRAARLRPHEQESGDGSGLRIRLLMPASAAEAGAVVVSLSALAAQTHPMWSLHVAWTEGTAALPAGDDRLSAAPWDPAAAVGDLWGEADLFGLLRPGDILRPDALGLLGQAFADNAGLDMAYADEETVSGARLKPDWSPDLALATGYVGAPALISRAFLARWPARAAGPAECFAAVFDVAACAATRVAHVPRVLCRRTAAPEDLPLRAALLTDASDPPARPEIRGGVLDLHRRRPQPAPLVSVIIPSRDRLDLVGRVTEDVLRRTDYPAIDLVIVDNASTDPGVLALYERLRTDPRVRIEAFPAPFNFAAMVNAGAAAARGEILVLLNNDVTILDPGWLDALVAQAVRPDIGAVGAKLLYEDGSLQHAGVVVGLGGQAGHILRRRPAESPGHLGRMRVVHEVSAVTAACLAVAREKYEAVGGFDAETFAVDFNDVDFCLRLSARGWRCLWTPHAVLSHLESVSRGKPAGAARERFEREAAAFAERWRDVIRHDPFYHPALSLTTFGEDLE